MNPAGAIFGLGMLGAGIWILRNAYDEYLDAKKHRVPIRLATWFYGVLFTFSGSAILIAAMTN